MPAWDSLARQGIDLAGLATSSAFTVARVGTRVGFSITRGISGTAVNVATTVIDHALFGGSTITRPLIGGALLSILELLEQATMAPIYLGEYITSTSLLAAHSSINILSIMFPGDEASFSLASFIGLVKREWNDPVNDGHLPDKRYGLTQIARAVVAWAALQGVTQEWQEKRWLKHLRELHVQEPSKIDSRIKRKGSRIRVTSDIIYPGNSGQILAADIGDAPPRTKSLTPNGSAMSRPTLNRSFPSNHRTTPGSLQENISELKATLRRLSKMVLAGYGGASLLFFGVSPTLPATSHPSSSSPSDGQKIEEEASLATAIDASEAEAAGSHPPPLKDEQPYSWWDVLLGKHDQQIFEHYANNHSASGSKVKLDYKRQIRSTAVIGIEHQMPRFWVLTDHVRSQIVLVVRGTMSLNEIAADLTCEREAFEPARSSGSDEEEAPPGKFTFPPQAANLRATSPDQPSYFAHSGIYRMAKTMGEIGKPVHLAVHEALSKNPDYELVLCGHSLGAGVAAMLGLMWADPTTCLTVSCSGLPSGRRVSVYCFAPPCLLDPSLSKEASHMIVSFVYSHDVVSRLSLGSVRDLKNAASWLCEAEEANVGEGYSDVAKRAQNVKAAMCPPHGLSWFLAVRKTLEANMQSSDLFPPGRVLWAMRDSDLHPSHRSHPAHDSTSSQEDTDKLRLFEVLDAEKVFSQIVFARDMLSSHLPHTYDRVLHDLL